MLNVAARPGELFSEEELAFLETLGHQIGLAVERARHRQAERLRNQEARAMAAVSKAVGAGHGHGQRAGRDRRARASCWAPERVTVLLGADTAAMHVAHLSGLPHPELREGQKLDLVGVGAKLQIQAVRERAALAVDDWSNDPRVNRELARRWDAGSGLVLPMLARGHVLGLLVLTRRETSHWTDEQIDVAEAFAAQAALRLDNTRLYEEARRAYQELSEAQDRVIQQEKMAVLGTFASGLAHEVRNPLNSIGLQLTVLERRHARLDPAPASEMSELTLIIREEVQPSRPPGRRLPALRPLGAAAGGERRPGRGGGGRGGGLLTPEADDVGCSLAVRAGSGEPCAAACDGRREDEAGRDQPRAQRHRGACPRAARSWSRRVCWTARRALVGARHAAPACPEGVDVFQLFVTTKPKGTGLGLVDRAADRPRITAARSWPASEPAGRRHASTIVAAADRGREARQERSASVKDRRDESW